MLRRRRDTQAQAPGETKRGQEAHAPVRQSRHPARGLHRRAESGCLKGAIGAPAMSFDLFTIGHSNIPIDRFVALLRQAGVTAIADVRSVPASRRFPWFSKNNLAKRLAADGIDYTPMGDVL